MGGRDNRARPSCDTLGGTGGEVVVRPGLNTLLAVPQTPTRLRELGAAPAYLAQVCGPFMHTHVTGTHQAVCTRIWFFSHSSTWRYMTMICRQRGQLC